MRKSELFAVSTLGLSKGTVHFVLMVRDGPAMESNSGRTMIGVVPSGLPDGSSAPVPQGFIPCAGAPTSSSRPLQSANATDSRVMDGSVLHVSIRKASATTAVLTVQSERNQ